MNDILDNFSEMYDERAAFIYGVCMVCKTPENIAISIEDICQEPARIYKQCNVCRKPRDFITDFDI